MASRHGVIVICDNNQLHVHSVTFFHVIVIMKPVIVIIIIATT